jgi:hypothetical protein
MGALVHAKIRSLKLERFNRKVESLCVGKFSCDRKVRSLKKKLRTKPGLYRKVASS